MKLKLKLVYTLFCLCFVLVSALHLPQHASGDISGWSPFPGRKLLREGDFEKRNEIIHRATTKSRVVVNSEDTEHRYEDEGGLIFYNADYSLATTHASPLPKHHP